MRKSGATQRLRLQWKATGYPFHADEPQKRIDYQARGASLQNGQTQKVKQKKEKNARRATLSNTDCKERIQSEASAKKLFRISFSSSRCCMVEGPRLFGRAVEGVDMQEPSNSSARWMFPGKPGHLFWWVDSTRKKTLLEPKKEPPYFMF